MPDAASVVAFVKNGALSYDVSPWSSLSPSIGSFRSNLEKNFHDEIHQWIGGHMDMVAISPNDPAFFIHHCNVDRLWASWQDNFHKPYLPAQSESANILKGHRVFDAMRPWEQTSTTPATALDFKGRLHYSYDTIELGGCLKALLKLFRRG